MRTNNEEAAGATFSLIAVFVLSGLLFVLIGFGIDKVIATQLSMAANMPASQMRYDIAQVMIMALRVEPFIVLIGAGLASWIISLRSASGDVPLSELLLGASEMIILTFVMIALELFGGMGIEKVIAAVNSIQVPGFNVALFSAIQYGAPIFYGVCFLGLCFAIVQFLLVCVQVVDYRQSI